MGVKEMEITLIKGPRTAAVQMDVPQCITVEELVRKSIKYWEKGNYKVARQKSSLHEAGLLKLGFHSSKYNF